MYFNPRSPHGERQSPRFPMRTSNRISIHAPRTGSDQVQKSKRVLPCYFNPRSPHGERRYTPYPRYTVNTFQSTLPARGATNLIFAVKFYKYFNPRSPHGERHWTAWEDANIANHFNPRSPHGERPRAATALRLIVHFNPRSPHGERQRKVTILSIRIIGFAQKVYHKTVLLRISLAENAVILPKRPQNPVRTSLQKAGGLRFARAIRAARPYSISSPSGA